MTDGLSREHVNDALKELNCAPDGPPRAYPEGFGQYWLTPDGHKFFVRWLTPNGPINATLWSKGKSNE